MCRDCAQANTQAAGRTGSMPRASLRSSWLEPICMRSITSIGVTARKKSP
jgi:hypothetical protein